MKVQGESMKNSDKTLKNPLGFKQFKVNMTYFILFNLNIIKKINYINKNIIVYKKDLEPLEPKKNNPQLLEQSGIIGVTIQPG